MSLHCGLCRHMSEHLERYDSPIPMQCPGLSPEDRKVLEKIVKFASGRVERECSEGCSFKCEGGIIHVPRCKENRKQLARVRKMLEEK